MSNWAMDARVKHIDLLNELTMASRTLDAIEEVSEKIASKNGQICYSSEVTSKTKAQCKEIIVYLNELDALIMAMTDWLHEMDKETLELLKDSI